MKLWFTTFQIANCCFFDSAVFIFLELVFVLTQILVKWKACWTLKQIVFSFFQCKIVGEIIKKGFNSFHNQIDSFLLISWQNVTNTVLYCPVIIFFCLDISTRLVFVFVSKKHNFLSKFTTNTFDNPFSWNNHRTTHNKYSISATSCAAFYEMSLDYDVIPIFRSFWLISIYYREFNVQSVFSKKSADSQNGNKKCYRNRIRKWLLSVEGYYVVIIRFMSSCCQISVFFHWKIVGYSGWNQLLMLKKWNWKKRWNDEENFLKCFFSFKWIFFLSNDRIQC